jgi:hypothetical protein
MFDRIRRNVCRASIGKISYNSFGGIYSELDLLSPTDQSCKDSSRLVVVECLIIKACWCLEIKFSPNMKVTGLL